MVAGPLSVNSKEHMRTLFLQVGSKYLRCAYISHAIPSNSQINSPRQVKTIGRLLPNLCMMAQPLHSGIMGHIRVVPMSTVPRNCITSTWRCWTNSVLFANLRVKLNSISNHKSKIVGSRLFFHLLFLSAKRSRRGDLLILILERFTRSYRFPLSSHFTLYASSPILSIHVHYRFLFPKTLWNFFILLLIPLLCFENLNRLTSISSIPHISIRSLNASRTVCSPHVRC